VARGHRLICGCRNKTKMINGGRNTYLLTLRLP
jgi:hypothetical protein